MLTYTEWLEAFGCVYCVTSYDEVVEDDEPLQLPITDDDDPPF